MRELTAVVLCVIIGMAYCDDKSKPMLTRHKTPSAGSAPGGGLHFDEGIKGHDRDAVKSASGPAGKAAKPSDLKGADSIGIGFYGGVLRPPTVIPVPVPSYPRYYPGYYPRYYPGYYPRYGPYYPFNRRPYYFGGYPYRPRPIPVLLG